MNQKTYNDVVNGKADNNIHFSDFYAGSKAKGYQVRQLRNIIIKHDL